MDPLQMVAMQTWSETSDEGVLVVDRTGTIRLLNPCLQDLLGLSQVPYTVQSLLSQTSTIVPELRSLLMSEQAVGQAEWGNLRVERHPSQRLSWQRVPLHEKGKHVGVLTIFRDATSHGQLEVAKQSFLSMISHDLRTPLSTILGFAELLYNNRGGLSEDEQAEFLRHIIKNANDLSRYTQIALDVMYLEANMQKFEMQPVDLDRFVKHWLSDALHRLPAERIVFHNGLLVDAMAQIAPAALHRILYILVEFALNESDADDLIDIRVNYDASQAHVVVVHRAPGLTPSDAAVLFRLLHPRDLSEQGRPLLHRMQLYVASLLAERQQGYLTLRDEGQHVFELDLALPLAPSSESRGDT
jgi:two-component system phosphate regulon sensor histidine kinase PhoR